MLIRLEQQIQNKFIMAYQDNIKVMQIYEKQVAVRIRPFIQSEMEISNIEVIRVLDAETLMVEPAMNFKGYQNLKFSYVFDRLTSQKDIYERCLEYQVTSLLDGFNYTLFSYGPQNTGKSYSLMNQKDDYGMTIRILNGLFYNMAKTKRKIQVWFSYMEINQENLSDLLNSDNLVLEIREDPVKGPIVKGARELEITSTQEVINLLQFGKRHKKGGHEILSFQFVIHDTAGTTSDVKYSKLIIADLMSQERGGQKNQNISLQVLNNCIQALYESQEKKINAYIPYRNSKLTRLMKEALGGNSKALMLTCLSPSIVQYEDSVQALNYSVKALGIINSNHIQQLQNDVQKENFDKIIQDLKKENNELKKILQSKSNQPITSLLATEDDYIKKYEENILSQFSAEQDLENQIHTYNWESCMVRFRINENQHDLERIEGYDKKKAETLRQQVQVDNKQLENFEQHIMKLVNQKENLQAAREALIEQIRKTEIQETGKMYLNTLVSQYKLKLENLDIKHQEDINILNKQQQERELSILRSQLSLRDKIIDQQKRYLSNHQKTSSTVEILEGTKATLVNYPLPQINQKYINKQAMQQTRRGILKTPKKDAQTIFTKPYVPPSPRYRIIESNSLINLEKKKTPRKLVYQKPIDTRSMAFLPKLSPNRNLSKFVYDWRSGGYKFVEEQGRNPSFKQPTQESQIPQPSQRQRSENSFAQSFYSNGSKSSKRNSPTPRLAKSKILLPEYLDRSRYVQGFEAKDTIRKTRLQALNLKMQRK
ncbi:hypothetical protein pb186bvf_007754 [Paramecium bursaria]